MGALPGNFQVEKTCYCGALDREKHDKVPVHDCGWSLEFGEMGALPGNFQVEKTCYCGALDRQQCNNEPSLDCWLVASLA